MRCHAVLLAAVAAVVTACPAIRPSSTTVAPPEPIETTQPIPSTATSTSVIYSSIVVPEPIPTVDPEPVVEQPVYEPTTSTTSLPVIFFPPSETTLTTKIVPKPTGSSPEPATTSAPATGSGSDDTSTGPSDLGDEAVSGRSTFYGGNLSGGMCSFTTWTLPSGVFGTAFSGSAWDSSANCGACVEVTGPNGNSITAVIVDQCPECDEGHLDLFQNAFEKLGSISEGIIETSYKFVTCGISSPIVLHNKSGTSAYWFSMQVVNANEPIKSLEVSTDRGSTWQATSRAEYNFFEYQSGFGTASVDVRVTSTTGKKIVVSGVSVKSEAQATADSNF